MENNTDILLQKLKREVSYDPATLLLGINPEKIIIQEDTCTSVFIAALFTIARTWNREGNGTQPQYSCLENPMDRGAW